MRTGINVWDEEWELGRLDFDKNSPTWGQNVNTEAQIRSKNYVRVQANTSYYCKSGTASTVYAIFYDANKNPVLETAGIGYTQIANVSFTTPGSAHYLRFYVLSTTTYSNDISINQPANDHEYHSYVGNTYNIAFPAEAGTVYGGTLDVTNGVLTVDRAMVTFNGGSSEQWWLAQDYTNRFGNNKTGTFCDGIVEHQISNWLKSSSWGNTSFTFGLRSNGSLYICLDASAEQITETQFRAYLASTPLQIVYTLATPVTYNLTAEQIALLRGTNNVWADCGDTTLRYFLLGVDDIINEISAMISNIGVEVIRL